MDKGLPGFINCVARIRPMRGETDTLLDYGFSVSPKPPRPVLPPRVGEFSFGVAQDVLLTAPQKEPRTRPLSRRERLALAG